MGISIKRLWSGAAFGNEFTVNLAEHGVEVGQKCYVAIVSNYHGNFTAPAGWSGSSEGGSSDPFGNGPSFNAWVKWKLVATGDLTAPTTFVATTPQSRQIFYHVIVATGEDGGFGGMTEFVADTAPTPAFTYGFVDTTVGAHSLELSLVGYWAPVDLNRSVAAPVLSDAEDWFFYGDAAQAAITEDGHAGACLLSARNGEGTVTLPVNTAEPVYWYQFLMWGFANDGQDPDFTSAVVEDSTPDPDPGPDPESTLKPVIQSIPIPGFSRTTFNRDTNDGRIGAYIDPEDEIEYTDNIEILYSTAYYTEKGVTLAPDGQILPAGTAVTKGADKLYHQWQDGDVCAGVLRRGADTTTGVRQEANIVITGTLKLAAIPTDTVTALQQNGAAISTGRGSLRF